MIFVNNAGAKYIYTYMDIAKEKVSSYPVSQLLFQIHARKTK